MRTVRQMLRNKPDVFAVRPDDTVYHALQTMAERNIGAVLVMLDDELQGILSERDYARKGVLHGHASKDTPVSQLMTSRVISVDGDATVDQCMALMTDKRVRHLPVIENGRVSGVISIGDVVRAVVEEQQFTIDALQTYIATA
jgi:CBS domain-containing protein